MPYLSSADHQVNPPVVDIPRHYNAAYDLLQRNIVAERGDKVAFIDDAGSYTYNQLNSRTAQLANALRADGMLREQRILMCVHDTIDFPTVFLGAIKAGIIPVAVNTLLTQQDYQYMLTDSRADVAIVSAALMPLFAPLLDDVESLKKIIVAGAPADDPQSLDAFISTADDTDTIAETTCDEPCFWLYSSGSTGSPKGTVHVHSSLINTAELYAKPVLGITEDDVVYSAAKLFFAYGLGNGLTFPMSVGATAVLMAERPTPNAVAQRLTEHQPTIFYGVPTLYAGMLSSEDLPAADDVSIRICASAGEALPADLSRRWREHFGVEILDGIGSTEMLHIFLSNSLEQHRDGTTGKPVPGYEVRLVDDDGEIITCVDEAGEMQVKGPTTAACYWNNREKTQNTFLGDWTRSGDKYHQDSDGYYVYAGRSDDMLKVSGIYVSPIEVESTLISHEAVLEAAVVGKNDNDDLIKPAAYIVLKQGFVGDEELAGNLKQYVKSQLAPYKYPRWFEFVEDLPKTATGKIQRFKLRDLQT